MTGEDLEQYLNKLLKVEKSRRKKVGYYEKQYKKYYELLKSVGIRAEAVRVELRRRKIVEPLQRLIKGA